jgi:hypothetical protein
MLKYLTDKNLSLNAKVLLSIVLFQDEIVGTEIEKLCIDDREAIKDALLELRINKYVKYDSESEKLIAAPTPYTEWDKDDYELNDMIKMIKDNSINFNKILSQLEESKFGGYKLNKQQKERLQDLLKELNELTNYFDNYKNIINSLDTINDSLNYQINKNHELIKEKDSLIKDNKKMKEESIDQNDSITFLKAILNDKNDKELDLVTYLSKNVNENYGTSKSLFKKITDDLKSKGLLSNDEYQVILRPPRIINKSEINRALSSINREMEEAVDEFENLFQYNENDDYYF